jgi:hypothetical protein
MKKKMGIFLLLFFISWRWLGICHRLFLAKDNFAKKWRDF